MSLTKLGIRNVRNIDSADIIPSKHLNLIFGENASGKTSFLEAIYMLGRGKSFRSHRIDKVIQTGCRTLSAFGVVDKERGGEVRVGLERNSSELKIRIDEKNTNSVSELASLLPIQVIHPNSHKLLEEGPKYRRNFLDWGVFHVEHSFYPAWKRYQRGLKQRNAALRSRRGRRAATAWDPEIIDAAGIIHNGRSRYVEVLNNYLPDFIKPIMGNVSVEIDYHPGWKQNESYEKVLRDRLEQDFDQGFTKTGPHRADLDIKLEGVSAADRVSRGQQKILVASCLLAQAGVYTEKTGKSCILLVDDLAAELDNQHRVKLLNTIAAMNVQLFVTAIDAAQLVDGLPDADIKMFHVKHGKLKEMVQ